MPQLFMSLTGILLLAYVLTLIGVIISVILENRNPLKTSAWVLLIGLIPFVGILAYIIFGQEQRKLYRINKRYYKRLLRYPQMFSVPFEEIPTTDTTEQYKSLIQLVERNSDAPLLTIDNYDVYTRGGDYYAQLLEDIRCASKHIHIECYIFDDDDIFALLSEALVAKRAEGLDVRIIYDDLGTSVSSKRWQTLKQQGLQIYPFLPVKLPLLASNVNYRNHRKVCIIDGRIGYVGGMNFAQRYQDGDELGPWRDTHFRIEGAAVASLQAGFLMDWYTVSKRLVRVEQLYSKQLRNTPAVGSLSQFIFGGPLGDYQAIEQALIAAIYHAKAHIRIQTPYFLPTEPLYSALIIAALSGVKVELMVPRRGDSSLTTLAMNSYFDALLKAGAEIYLYEEGFLHSKLVLIDEALSCIGSSNVDFRSLEHNFEVMGLIYDTEMALHLMDLYERDKVKCSGLNYKLWRERSFGQRIAESTMRLFSPLL